MKHLSNITLLLGVAMILLPLLAQEPPEGLTVESDFCQRYPDMCAETAPTFEWLEVRESAKEDPVLTVPDWDKRKNLYTIQLQALDAAILEVPGKQRRYLLEIDRASGEMKLSEVAP